jgi:hypothetical protein
MQGAQIAKNAQMLLDLSVEKAQEGERAVLLFNFLATKLQKERKAATKETDKCEEGQLKSSGPGGKPTKVVKAMKAEKVMKKPARRTTHQQGEPHASPEVLNDPHKCEDLANDTSCSSQDGPMEHENAIGCIAAAGLAPSFATRYNVSLFGSLLVLVCLLVGLLVGYLAGCGCSDCCCRHH